MIHGSNVIDTLRVSKDHRFHKRSLHALTTKPIGMDRVSLELDEEPQRQLHHAQVKAHLSAIVRTSLFKQATPASTSMPPHSFTKFNTSSKIFTFSGCTQQQTQAKMDT